MAAHHTDVVRRRRARSLTAALVALLALLAGVALTACSVSVGGSAHPDGDRPSSAGHGTGHGTASAPRPAPPPRPTGAVYGRVLEGDGAAAADASVVVSQPGDYDLASNTVKLTSLGLICLLPTHGVCGSHRDAAVDAAGQWSLQRKDVQERKPLVVTATDETTSLSTTAPSTVATLENGPDPQRVPDLVLWRPHTRTRRAAGGLRVTWSPLAYGPRGPDVTYTVSLQNGQDFDSPQVALAHHLSGTSYVVPAWATEGSPYIVIAASTTTRVASFVYATQGVALRGGPPPLSRGKACAADRGGRLVEARQPCALTDGVLGINAQVRVPGDCDSDRRGCQAASHHRICVDLGRTEPVSLVVVRTPFLVDGDVVELSDDGEHFLPYGPLGTSDFDTSGVFRVPFARGAHARYVCVRNDESGFDGSFFDEISVF